MSPFRRLSSVVRGRRLLAAGAFLFLAYLFANNLSPRPRYVVQTGGKVQPVDAWKGCVPPRTMMNHVSDDGCLVIVGVSGGPYRLELWDTRTGVDRTPVHWTEPRWTQFLIAGDEPELDRFLADPEGRAFVLDAGAWVALDERFTPFRTETGRSYPDGLCFSPDGCLVSYTPPKKRSSSALVWVLTGGPVVEETRTGRRVATFPAGTGQVLPAPGGRTAVSSRQLPDDRLRIRPRICLWFDEEGPPKKPTDRPYLSLWDLEERRHRAELLFPSPLLRVEYSPDGRYLFATTFSDLVRLWDAETGRPVADLYASQPPHFMAGGRLLVAASEDQLTLHFWDAATGRALADWDLEPPRNGRIDGLTFARDRFVFAEIDPDAGPAGGSGVRFLDRAAEWMSERVSGERRWKDRRQVLVLDVIERRTIGPVPGVAGNVSTNGRWLAALDADGVVRVWDLPIGRPWVRGFAYAATVFAGGWLVFGLPRRVWRGRAAREAPAEHSTASPVA